MAAKTNAQKLQEAIEKGDLEAAKVLAAKLAPKPKPKAAKPKRKAAVKQKRTKPQPEPEKLISGQPEATGIAPSRPQAGSKPGQVQCRRVSMKGRQFTNKFNPSTYDVKLAPKHAKLDVKLRKANIQPRPGEPGAVRGVAVNVEVVCDICRKSYSVPQWEAETVDGAGRYKCNRCIAA